MKKILNYTQYFENNNDNILYKNDGESNCPVCGSYSVLIKNDTLLLIEKICNVCKFEYSEIYEYKFVDSEDYEKDVDKISIENGYLSNGENSCPFCNSIDFYITETDNSGDEVYDGLHCNKCNKEWRRYKSIEHIKTLDKNNNEIEVGDLVPETLFNLKEYKKEQLRKKSNKYKI